MGVNKERVILTNLQNDKPKTFDLMLSSSYYTNKKLSHAATLNSKNCLIFGALELCPGTEFKDVILTVSGMDKIKDFQNIVLTSNQSIFGNINPLRIQFKNNSENQQEKKKDNKQVIDFFLEYPILAYIEEDQKSISLCNLLRPD